jgi:MOSC domain-containing protein YiiM
MRFFPELIPTGAAGADTDSATGVVRWLGLRVAHEQPMRHVQSVQAQAGKGLQGDRYKGGSGKRHVTLMQLEHLALIQAGLGLAALGPALTRRNIMVEQIDLLSLMGCRFAIGSAILEGTGPCDPCSKMDLRLGPGGFQAMRGRGGITARILCSGGISLGDAIILLPANFVLPADDLFPG